MKKALSFPIIALLILSLEKFIQHIVVTYAFWMDLPSIREFVSFDYRIFTISGFIVGILFLANIPFLIKRRRFSLYLLLFLALFDFFGEFIAQGTLMIEITVSILVALLIILILIFFRKRLFKSDGLKAQEQPGS